MIDGPSDVDPGRKTQLRSRGELQHPGTCVICGSAMCEEGYVDVDSYVEFYGVIYFCVTCVETEIIKAVGAIAYADFQYLKDLTAKQTKELADTKQMLAEKTEQYNNAAVLLDTIRRGLSPSVVSDLDSHAAENDSDVSDAEPADDEPSPEAADSGEPVAKKSGKGKRSDDVSKSSVDDLAGAIGL